MITVSVLDFGANGNGVFDNYKAFQDAEDFIAGSGGGIINVPAGIYWVSKPFYHRSLVTLNGVGDSSIIRNTSTVSGSSQFCIYIGNFSPSTFAECLHFDIKNVSVRNFKITLKDKNNSSQFTVGQTILIDSKDGFMSEDGHWKPYFAFINKVTKIDAVNGILTLEIPMTASFENAQAAPTDKFSTNNDPKKVYICQKPVIQNIRFESLGNWAMRFGVYRGLFQNISVMTTDIIGGNGFSWCTFENIRGEFSQKVVEMAMYSHDSVVQDFTATWWNGAADPQRKPLLKLGENQRDCLFEGINITANGGTNFGQVIRFDHAFDNEIRNCTFNCPTVTENGVELNAGDDLAKVKGNTVDSCEFNLGNTDYYIVLNKETPNAQLKNNDITRNVFNGGVNKDDVSRNDDNDTNLAGNVYN